MTLSTEQTSLPKHSKRAHYERWHSEPFCVPISWCYLRLCLRLGFLNVIQVTTTFNSTTIRAKRSAHDTMNCYPFLEEQPCYYGYGVTVMYNDTMAVLPISEQE
jgi:hypothetical protein